LGRKEANMPKRKSASRKPKGTKGNLGQKKAGLQKASNEQFRHMAGGPKAKAARKQKEKLASS